MAQKHALSDFDNVTCPIYSETKGGFDHEGTVALIQSRKSHWVVTASHVIVGNQVVRYWIGARPLQPLGEEKVHYCKSPADVAFFQLSEEKARAVQATGVRFLPLSSFGQYQDGQPKCVVTGYPYRWERDPSVKIDHESATIEVQQMIYRSTLLTKAKLNFVPNVNPAIHVAVQASQMHEDLTGKNIALKKFDFRRLSGGIIWQRQSDKIARAIGIVTDHYPRQKLLIGTIVAPLIFRMAETFGSEF